MNTERFLALMDAYGGDLQRWPEGERAAALALSEHGSPDLRQRLADAALLDGWLAQDIVAAPDEALVHRVMADASNDARVLPGTRSSSVTTRTPWWRSRWLWPSAGLAGIGLAGSLAGAFTVSVALGSAAQPTIDWPERGTAFTSISPDWSEE